MDKSELGLDQTHSLMTIIPKDVRISEVEETLGTIKSLGRVRVRGRNFSARLNRRMVLCEPQLGLPPTCVQTSGAQRTSYNPHREEIV
uniref:Uncharacterized protein n=1 Tax=Fundulus heteroclitus TaxID=8078 RepID=A0A3Q2UN23_FUNHE